MNRDIFIRNLTHDRLVMSPKGRNANELTIEEFEENYEKFFDMVYEIATTDISSEAGYGEFDENNRALYGSVKEFILETFNEEKECYWKHWKEMFETSFLKKDYFEEILSKAIKYSGYCEGQRYLVNNNTFFCNIMVDRIGKSYCIDWGRAGIMDFMMDIAIMDLDKPYFMVPEKLYEYAKKRGIEIKNFKERFLCMAYFKGIDTLRWHASIDDLESCESIVNSINALEERMAKLDD